MNLITSKPPVRNSKLTILSWYSIFTVCTKGSSYLGVRYQFLLSKKWKLKMQLTKGCLQDILRHVSLVHVPKPYFLQTHVHIIFHLHLELPWKPLISSASSCMPLVTSILTLRRLMLYIYMEHPFLMFLDHTQRRSTVGRTPLDE